VISVKGVLSASRMPVQSVLRYAEIECSVRRSLISQFTVADVPVTSKVLSTGALPPFVYGPRSQALFAHRGSGVSGTNGGPTAGPPGASGANGIVAPGQPAATLAMAVTGAVVLTPLKTNGDPFSSSFE